MRAPVRSSNCITLQNQKDDDGVLSTNSRPCGFYGDTTRECRCTPAIIQRYLGKISGPLLDRIERTRQIQHDRGHYNAQLPTKLLRKLRRLDDSGERTLEMAMRRLALSARA